MDIRQLNEMSYPDFVGYINQWNVLPGSYVTLSKWATFSHMNANSRILQFACSISRTCCSYRMLWQSVRFIVAGNRNGKL